MLIPATPLAAPSMIKHPLPAAETEPSVCSQESGRDRRPQETRNWNRDREPPYDPRTILGRETNM